MYMKNLFFTGRATSYDREPIHCFEQKEISTKKIVLKNYPLSMIEVEINNEGILVDDNYYEWNMFPITIKKTGNHVTKYRDIVEEDIIITIEIK